MNESGPLPCLSESSQRLICVPAHLHQRECVRLVMGMMRAEEPIRWLPASEPRRRAASGLVSLYYTHISSNNLANIR